MPPAPRTSESKSPGFNKSFTEKYFADLNKSESAEKKKRKLVFSQVPRDGNHNRSHVNATQHNRSIQNNNPHSPSTSTSMSTQNIDSTYNSSMVSSPTQPTSPSSDWRVCAQELMEKANDTYRDNPSDQLSISAQESDPMRAGVNLNGGPNPHPVPTDGIRLVHEHLEDNDDEDRITWDSSRDHYIDSDG